MSDSEHDEWVPVAEGLPPGEGKTVKTRGRQLAVFRLRDGRACAIDNRCPHEGYPLATGRLEGEQLTCEWHNWKFALPSGACLVGGEAVQAYETKVEGDTIFARLVDPPAGDRVGALYAGLVEAIDDEDRTRVARTIERLLAAGEAAAAILGFVVDLASRRAEWGFHHGHAASGDLVARLSGDDDALVLLQATELLTDGLVRRPEVPFAEPSVHADARALAAAIGEERREDAEALVMSGAREDRLAALAEAATDGFLSYGHGLIFVAQAERLLEGLEAAFPDAERAVLPSLTRALVYSTREERLPTFRGFHRALEDRAPLALHTGAAQPLALDPFLAAVLDGSLTDALDAVDQAIADHVPATEVALGLALGASHRLLRFDPAHEADHDVVEGWLDVTHALTYAEAAHALLTRRPSVALLRALRYGARFVQYLAPLDAPAPPALPEAQKGVTLAAALDARDEASARAIVRDRPLDELAAPLHQDMLGDRLVRQIFVSHHIKMTCASLRLAAAMEPLPHFRAHARLPLEATVRWLCHPVRERRLARAAHVAALFVREGRRPRELV